MVNLEHEPQCPECRAGKHDNCHGDAWDNENDRPAICACWAAGHQPLSWENYVDEYGYG